MQLARPLFIFALVSLFLASLGCDGGMQDLLKSKDGPDPSAPPTIPVVRDSNTLVDPAYRSDPRDFTQASFNYVQRLRDLRASSTLPPQGKNSYQISRVSDANPFTAWTEGDTEYGVGESITFTWKEFMDGSCTKLVMMNGYQKGQSHMENNSRIRTMDVYADDNLVAKLEIQDRLGAQYFSNQELGLRDNQNIKLVITGVYKGIKWKDTCLSELGALCLP